jgi:hypothetical protein
MSQLIMTEPKKEFPTAPAYLMLRLALIGIANALGRSWHLAAVRQVAITVALG